MSVLRESLEQEIPHLRRTARALAVDRETADDLVQETLLRALASADEADGAALRLRLLGLLVTADRNRRRGSGRRSADGAAAASPNGPPGPPGPAGALARLSPEHREVLALVVLEGLSYAECAEVLGLPQEIVLSRLARARALMRELIEGVPASSGTAHLRIVK